MSEHPSEGEKLQPGFCSATPLDRGDMRAALQQPAERCTDPVAPRTSDLFHTCNLPKRFDHPHWFNGYGSQVSQQHPLYRTSSNEYGWYPPGYHTVPLVYFPAGQRFTNHLLKSGIYRNYGPNTAMDSPISVNVPCGNS